MPEHFGLGVSREQALLIRALLEEAAPHCEQCAALLHSVNRQLIALAGGELPPEGRECGNCTDSHNGVAVA